MDPDGRYRLGQPLAGRRQADRRQWHDGQRLRHRARSSAHGLCAAERRRAGRREQRAAEAGRRQGHQGLYLQAGAELGGRRGSERQPHHAVARCRWRRRRRNAQHLPQRAEFAVRHGAGRRGFLCRQYRCDHEIPLSRGRHQDQRARRQACGPARRHAQSPLDQGPHGKPGRHEALCNRRLQQQCRRERHGGREGSRGGSGSRPRQRPMARVRLGLAQPERPGLESEDRRALGRRQRARRTRQ